MMQQHIPHHWKRTHPGVVLEQLETHRPSLVPGSNDHHFGEYIRFHRFLRAARVLEKKKSLVVLVLRRLAGHSNDQDTHDAHRLTRLLLAKEAERY